MALNAISMCCWLPVKGKPPTTCARSINEKGSYKRATPPPSPFIAYLTVDQASGPCAKGCSEHCTCSQKRCTPHIHVAAGPVDTASSEPSCGDSCQGGSRYHSLWNSPACRAARMHDERISSGNQQLAQTEQMQGWESHNTPPLIGHCKT